jgi:hypothetical protein
LLTPTCAVMTSLVAAPGATLKAPLVAEARPPLVAVSV